MHPTFNAGTTGSFKHGHNTNASRRDPDPHSQDPICMGTTSRQAKQQLDNHGGGGFSTRVLRGGVESAVINHALIATFSQANSCNDSSNTETKSDADRVISRSTKRVISRSAKRVFQASTSEIDS